MKPRAYSYVRFSSPEQSKGDSFRRQTELSRSYAETHGLELDTQLTFQDLGVSAFKGANVAEGGALGQFIQAVDAGRIAPGSYLLVESLDRLSRAAVMSALSQFSSLLDRGITVVTLQDGKVFTKAGLGENFGDLMVSLAVMFRAHEESATKSKRLRSAWSNARQAAFERGRKLTSVSPGWLRLNADRTAFEVIEERADVVRRVFSLTLDGIGKGRIAAILNEEGVPAFGRAQGWHQSYVQKLLESGAVIGEYQPNRMETKDGKTVRVPDGPLLTDYFPPIVSRADFVAAKTARAARRIGTGRKGETFSNLFTGLARCGVCGAPMHFINKGEGEHYLSCSFRRRRHGGCTAPSWAYRPVERFTLQALREVNFSDLFPEASGTLKGRVQATERALTERGDLLRSTEGQLSGLLVALADRPTSAALLGKLDELEGRKAVLVAELDELTSRLSEDRDAMARLSHETEAMADGLEAFAKVQRDDDEPEVFRIRSRLHQLLKRTVKEITLTPSSDPALHGSIRCAFKNVGSYVRELRVMKGQREGYSLKVVDGREEERVFFGLGRSAVEAPGDCKAKGRT